MCRAGRRSWTAAPRWRHPVGAALRQPEREQRGDVARGSAGSCHANPTPGQEAPAPQMPPRTACQDGTASASYASMPVPHTMLPPSQRRPMPSQARTPQLHTCDARRSPGRVCAKSAHRHRSASTPRTTPSQSRPGMEKPRHALPHQHQAKSSPAPWYLQGTPGPAATNGTRDPAHGHGLPQLVLREGRAVLGVAREGCDPAVGITTPLAGPRGCHAGEHARGPPARVWGDGGLL